MPPTTSIHQYNEAFLREMARLNPAQREAVEQTEGPVLVVAGPGTGKTHILAARIGNILLQTDAQPHNILCLTFTDAGVHAMRHRLLEFIGPEAHRVHIFTFHSFCNKIIQDNLELFGRRELEPLSDLERVEIIRHLLEAVKLDNPLRRGQTDIFFYENHLSNLFQRMKSEDWSVEFVLKRIDEYLDDLPNRDEFRYKISRGEFKKGDLRLTKLEDAKVKMERLKAAVRLYPLFGAKMREYHRYDYDDMILWVLRAFEKHPALLRTYQEQYLYFLVDEYQDTNGAQNEVLQRLVEYWDNPNLFIVGDDDQSIYEFQGARLKNITDFYYRYRPALKIVVLKENYRSSQHILDTAKSLIGYNEIRITHHLESASIEKILVACHEHFAASKLRPHIVEYPDRLQEEIGIASQIEMLQTGGFPLDEVAVIYAKHRQAERLMELLKKKGVPFRTRRPVNVLELPLIRNLRIVLEYLQAEFDRSYSGEHLLFRLMHFDFFGIQPHDLARLAIGIEKEKANWRDAITDGHFLNKLSLQNAGSLSRLSEFLESMLAGYANLSVPSLIESIINRSGLLRRVLEYPEKEWWLQVLFTFSNFIKQESVRNPRFTLSDLLETLKSMEENRLQLAAENQSKHGTGQQAVNLMTAHSAKGLEFQIVFMLDCVADNWGPNGRGSNYEFSFPDTLTLSGEEDAEEARRRLFYVGMTRAKESLQLSYAAQNEEGKELTRVKFLDEIAMDGPVEIERKEIHLSDISEAQATLLMEAAPVAPSVDRDMVAAMLEGFTLSVTSMNKFLRCPLSFFYENVLRVPVMASDAANYGAAMHNALRKGFEKMVASKEKLFPPVEEFVRFFEYELYKLQGLFSKKEYQRRLEMGKQHIAGFCAQNIRHWPKEVRVEQEFKNVEVDGVPITGVIDRIDFHSGTGAAHIVDYKTGSHEKSRLYRPSALRNKSKHQKPGNDYGGNYWRQLVFYKILYENWRNNPVRAVSAEISYLNPDAKGEFRREGITFEPGDVSFVKDIIKATYGKIMRQEFYEGCGERRCAWCSFLKGQGQVQSFAEEEIEELDD